MKTKIGLFLALVSFLVWSGCGSVPAYNKVLLNSNDKNRLDSLLAVARLHYDQGNYTEAMTEAETAYALNPDLEPTAQLLGFIYLAKASIDPFDIVTNLITQQASSTATASTSLAESSNASTILNNLATTILDLKKSDLNNIATPENSTNSFFSNLEVFLPKTLGDTTTPGTARTDSPTLKYINKAISVVCPFVNSSILASSTDKRHKCTSSPNVTKNMTQSHIIFALAHLTEALMFNSVLTYQNGEFSLADSSTTIQSNLFKRANVLNGTIDNSKITEYVEAVDILKNDISSIFSDSTNSMLSATIVDLNMVAGAFGAINGIPTSVTSNITKSLKSLKTDAKSAGSKESSLGGQTSALKSQMNSAVVSKVQTSIAAFNASQATDASKLTTAQQAERKKLCSSYSDIVKGLSISAPFGCPGGSTTPPSS